MAQQLAYNPYAQPGAPAQSANPYGGNPLQQEAPRKTFSVPTWVIWLLGLAFITFTGWLIWYLFFT